MPKCEVHCNFIEITLQHGCSPVNLLHIFFSKCDQIRSFLGIWSHLLVKNPQWKTSFFVQ